MASLRFLTGPLAGVHHEISDELVLGRSAADINIDDPEISRRHVRLRIVSEGVSVQDLGSSNGTFVSDARVAEQVTVSGTAIVRIGQTTFQLIGGTAAQAGGTRISGAPLSGGARVTPALADVNAPAHAPVTARAQAVAAPALPAYKPIPTPRPRRGPATRLIAPAVLTALVIIVTAAALVIYFASR